MKFGTFENREYVVMMTDIRRSTQIIHQKNGEINMFIIFYVYAGIVANIVDFYNGISTEYLGDGVLNIFDTTAGKELAIQKSISAGRDILIAREVILNPLFRESYLPMIDLGIGIAVGKTIVTRFGYSGATDLKAFGKCTYQVTRLCKGVNEIHTTDLISSINAVDSLRRQFYTSTVCIPGINGLFYKINYYNERYY